MLQNNVSRSVYQSIYMYVSISVGFPRKRLLTRANWGLIRDCYGGAMFDHNTTVLIIHSKRKQTVHNNEVKDSTFFKKCFLAF